MMMRIYTKEGRKRRGIIIPFKINEVEIDFLASKNIL